MILDTLKYIYNQILVHWNPSNYIPPVLPYCNILNIIDIDYESYIRHNLNLSTYNYETCVSTPTNCSTFNYIYRFTPYNCPFQSPWGNEVMLNTGCLKIYNPWCYKIIKGYWFQLQGDLYTVQVACLPTELYTFSIYNPFTFTFGVPTVEGILSQRTDNDRNNISLLEIKTILSRPDRVSQSAPTKSINSRFKEVTGSETQNINDPLAFKTTNLGYILDNSDLNLKTLENTTELPFIPEFYTGFIFFSQYILLFISSLIFLFPSKNFKPINLNLNINYQVLWLKKYPKLITKVLKYWINYIFKWGKYY